MNKILKLLFLIGFAVTLASCGGGKGGGEPNVEKLKTAQEAGLEPTIHKEVADSKLTVQQKNLIFAGVKSAITSKTTQAERDAAITKSVKDNGGDDALAGHIKALVDSKHPIGPAAFTDPMPANFSATTYALLKSLANNDDANGINTKLNKLLTDLASVYAANHASNAARATEIAKVAIPAGISITHKDIQDAMDADKDLGTGGGPVNLEGADNLNKAVHDLFAAVSTAAAAADKNAVNAALNNVLGQLKTILANADNTITSRQIRETRIDALPDVAGLDKVAVKREMQEHHPLIDDLTTSTLKQDTYNAVVTTANANMDVKKRNALMPLIAAAKALGTTALRTTAVENAIRTVRGIAAGTALAGEDATMATAILTAIAADYAITATDCASISLTFDEGLCGAINALGRTPEQKNLIIGALTTIHQTADPAARLAAVTAAITNNGGADAAVTTAVNNAVTTAYFPAAPVPSFEGTNLDLPVYAAIRDLPAPVTGAQKQGLIGTLRGHMDARPRVQATRDQDIANQVTIDLGGANLAVTNLLVAAANKAQPITALPAKDAAMHQNIYDAVVGGGAIMPPLPLDITNAQMATALPLILDAIKVRPRVQATRDRALKAAVVAALGLPAGSVLAVGSPGSVWYTRIKTQVDAHQAVLPALVRPAELKGNTFDGLYNAVTQDVHATNTQMNAVLAGLNAILTDAANRVAAARRAAVKELVRLQGEPGTAAALADIVALDASPNASAWATAIADAAVALLGEELMDGADPELNGLDGNVYKYVIGAKFAGIPSAQLNALLKAMGAAILLPEGDKSILLSAPLRAAFDAFPWPGANDRVKKDEKRDVEGLFNYYHHKDINPAPTYKATVDMPKATEPKGFWLKDTTDTKKYYFLPSDKLNGLPVERGDEVQFNDVSADMNMKWGTLSWGNDAYTVTQPIVDVITK